MTAMLSTKELACLYTKLEAPVTVADLLDRHLPLTEDESFALTIMFSEMTPDQALISMACCMQIIASRIEEDPSLTTSLNLQSNFILDDYAPHWLKQQAKAAPSGSYGSWSTYMQEDLEAMSELMMMCADIFGVSSVVAAEICTIMQDQASAHAEALDSALPEAIEAQIETLTGLVYGDNVIPFPTLRRA